MTRIAVNSTPKSVKGSKRNNLSVDLKNLNQSKVDLNLIHNILILRFNRLLSLYLIHLTQSCDRSCLWRQQLSFIEINLLLLSYIIITKF